MSDKQFPEPCVGILIFNKDKVLLFKSHKWHDKYCIPGGHIEMGETIEQAIRRELREETGLEVYDIRFLQVQECVYDDAFHKKKHFIFLDFVARTKSTEVKMNEEAQEFVWVTLKEALKMPTHKFTSKTIEFAAKNQAVLFT
jgi:nucleoside triphosphatase